MLRVEQCNIDNACAYVQPFCPMSKHRRKDGSWQSRRSAESRQVEEGYYAWVKRRQAEGRAPLAPRRKPWATHDTYGGLADEGPYQ